MEKITTIETLYKPEGLKIHRLHGDLQAYEIKIYFLGKGRLLLKKERVFLSSPLSMVEETRKSTTLWPTMTGITQTKKRWHYFPRY